MSNLSMLKLLLEKEHLLNVEAAIVKLVCKLLISDAQLELERQNWGRRPFWPLCLTTENLGYNLFGQMKNLLVIHLHSSARR